jgi:hypothetical protein
VRKINITFYREEKNTIYWIKIVALQEEQHPREYNITPYINIVFTTSLSSYEITKDVGIRRRLSSRNIIFFLPFNF